MINNHFSCRICSNRDDHPTFTVREMMFGTRANFEYFQCKSCHCLQITNVPTDLSKYYPHNYYSLQGNRATPRHMTISRPRAFLERLRAGNALFGKGHRRNKLAAYLVDLPPEINPTGPLLKQCGINSWRASFLDVGCGSRSWWLGDLKALGFKSLVGVDPHIEHDINEYGVRILKAQIQDINDQYDLIALHHSLEHIPDQIGTLQAVKSRLKPSGHCLIRIPLVSSRVWEIYGTDWVELDAPRHLYLHSLKSIALLGKKVGLELVRTTWDSGPFEFYGSEQYRRDIPLVAENSFWNDPSQSDFTYREMAAFSALALNANQAGRGGRGCFIFRSAER